MKFQSRAVVVDAIKFERPENPANPPMPFELDPCACDAMDGYTCGRHRREPDYGYHVGWSDKQRSIRIGQWAVRLPDGQWEVLSESHFHAKYEVAPRGGPQEPTP